MNKEKRRTPSLPRIISPKSTDKNDNNFQQYSSTLPKYKNDDKPPPAYSSSKDLSSDDSEMNRTYTVTDGLSDLIRGVRIKENVNKIPEGPNHSDCGTRNPNGKLDTNNPKIPDGPWSNKLPSISKKTSGSPSPDCWSRSHFELHKFKETLQH